MTGTSTAGLDVRCDREDLLAALQAADAVVPSSSSKPILTNLQFEATQDSMEIIATDLQVGLRAVLRRLEVRGVGQVVIPARQIVSILKESTSPTVTLTLVEQNETSNLNVVLADGDYAIPAVIGENFPPVSSFPNDAERLVVPGATLERMIKKTSFAVDKDRTSAVLSGVFMAVGDKQFVLAATDGKVLCEAVDESDGYAFEDQLTAIIPSVTVNHLSRILAAGHPEQVEIALAGKLLFIRTVIGGGEGGVGGIQVELSSRLVEGSYPAYRNALPSTAESKVIFHRNELQAAVRRTALMTSSASRGLVMALRANEGILQNLNNTAGMARIPVPCDYAGQEIRLGINASYIGDVLRVHDNEEVTIELNGPGKGMIIRDAGVTFLIMPITLPS